MALGSQLAASVLVLGAIGWFADNHFGTSPTWLIVGLSVGSVVGFVQFFRSVQAILNDQKTKSEEKEN